MESTKIPPFKCMVFPNLPEITITKKIHHVENIKKALRPAKDRVSCQSAPYNRNYVFQKSSKRHTKHYLNRLIKNSYEAKNSLENEMSMKVEVYPDVTLTDSFNNKKDSGEVLQALL